MHIKEIWKSIDAFLQLQFVKTENVIFPFSIFCLAFYSLFYLINDVLYSDAHSNIYDNMTLRTVISLLYTLLVFKNYWPKRFQCWMPLYWYCCVVLAIPFFMTFMTLKNQVAAPWVLNSLAMSILMIMLVNWVLYAVLLFVGISLAWVAFSLSTPEGFIFNPSTITIADIVNTFVTSIIIGVIFSRKKTIYQDTTLAAEKARTDSMRLVGASIAHELRTPLQAIKLLGYGISSYLPSLTITYRIAQQRQLEVPFVRNTHLEILERSINSIELQVNHSMVVIDSLLNNISLGKLENANFEVHSMNECVNAALEAYPFTKEQRKLIHWYSSGVDFSFLGSANLIKQVLFNLFKNALYFITAARRGEIYLSLEVGNKYNRLCFKDTAQGIPDVDLPYVFDKFFTQNTRHGTGIGLAFCKMCMQEHGGDIECQSKYEEYTRFALLFPKLDEK